MRSGSSSLLVAVLAAALVGAVAGPALAAPSDQPGGTTGVLDSAELTALQDRAASVQGDLQERQSAVAAAQQQLAQAQQAADAAAAEVADAQAVLDQARVGVSRYAAAVYRDGGAPTALSLLLEGGDPGDVVSAMGYLEAVDAANDAVLQAAQDRRRQARADQDAAAASVADRQAQADAVAAQVGDLEAAAAAVTDQLEGALGAVDRQLAQLQAEQVQVDQQTAAAWQSYVDQLTAAGVGPPPAAALRDPVAGLPAGLVPVGGSTGAAQPGAAQLPRQPTSLLVLPAETVTAVSAAMADLGLPFAPGTAGPESFDCGSLVQSAYGAAGIALPATQGELFATTSPVAPADVLPGDLVFLGTPESGLSHVGIALDPRTMLAADGRAGAVVVRTLPADQVLGIGRPSLPQRTAVPVPGPTGGALAVECGNTVYPASYDGSRQWGGYPNGLIPPSALCPLGVGGHALRCDAAAAYRAMSAAYAARFGSPLCITDSYRSYASQVTLYGQKPALAAVPGTSNHGWGLAVDLCGGIESYSTAQYAWMVADAGRFGFIHPTWADPGNGREEPWHWEYAGS
ncbi:D-alanyl-D-alanine carboxypeptidase family protein [Klenkia sp. PcliD-1-E]|uniref:D-alanyl-D-alanine carboxypeptidase family protein n=1 Tax=Klenkia sp. PcliD-1-E TaxID=2954492 RepID=UPI002097F648|nr:D-alanyl-D-alanine carboxypeptidase family protein [Klenkia sp. PcliD-1-E]MCO7222034.1 D-alanyl-D-alanine carboxypeptidase family protein [Klenkia sp. PcliD-1-E]